MVENFLAKKIQNLNELYALFCTATKAPFLICDSETFDDEIFIFSNEDDAKREAEKFGEKKYQIAVIKMPKQQINGFLASLYSYGVNAVVFFTGEEKNVVPLEQLFKKPDIEKLRNDKLPRINPDLQITALYFLQEVRRKAERTPDENKRVLEMEEEMAVNLFRSRYIVALRNADMNVKSPSPNQYLKFRVVTIKTKDGDIYMPCFSDISEFSKFNAANNNGRYNFMALPYDKLRDFCNDAKGVVVNPNGFNLILNDKSFERLNKLYRR